MKRLIVLASFLTLLGCGQQQGEVKGDAFEYAKKYVWGDKYNGCDYQTIIFSDSRVRMINSDKRIKEIAVFSKGATGSSIFLPKENNLDIVTVKSSREKFTIIGDKNNTSMVQYSVSGNSLIFESIFSLGKWKKIQRRKGIGNQSDFVSCGTR